MFTGLIQETSIISKVTPPQTGGYEIALQTPPAWNDFKLGESIAVNGVCLTLTAWTNQHLEFFVGDETLSKTHFHSLKGGEKVNLERSLALGDKLGGHMVSGHVDGTAKITLSQPKGDCLDLRLQVSREQFRFIVPKGSLCVNGVSLTVNAVNRETKEVDFYLIPETLERTNLGELAVGAEINIECDQLVKIIAHQLTQMEIAPGGAL